MYGFNQPYQQQTPAQRPSNMEWIMAPTVQQVEQVSVMPGQKAWVMVQSEPIFALRSADNMGLVQTDYYRFEKINPNTLNASPNAYDALEKRIEALERALGGQNESVN